MHTPFSSGIRFNREYLQEIRNEYPEAESKIAEIDSYWTKWMAENGQYTPMTCHASLAYERLLTMGVDGMREYVRRWRATNTAIKPECSQGSPTTSSYGSEASPTPKAYGSQGSPTTSSPLKKGGRGVVGAGWYDALLIILDGISGYINAYAVAAEEAAVKAPTAQRREELEHIASACRHIAHGSPRSFHEAVQLFYLIFSLCGHDSPGPIDRILYPHLKRDLDSSALSIEQAQEILDCLYLKFEEKTAYGATIGGQKRDGSDATNELSYMCSLRSPTTSSYGSLRSAEIALLRLLCFVPRNSSQRRLQLLATFGFVNRRSFNKTPSTALPSYGASVARRLSARIVRAGL